MNKLFIAMAVLLNTTAAYAQDCGEKQAEITPISTIQGEEWQSPLVGQNVTTSGTVTGKWTANDQLAGFFIQSTEPDINPRTSEGLFVNPTTFFRRRFCGCYRTGGRSQRTNTSR